MAAMSTPLRSDYLAFAEQVRSAPDSEAAWALLQNRLRALGFIHAKYGFVMAHPGVAEVPDILYIGALCEEYEAAFPDPPGPAGDAVVAHGLVSDDPLTYAGLYGRAESGMLNPAQTENHLTAREIGMRNGVAFALPDATMLTRGGISLEAAREETPVEFHKRLMNFYPELRLLVEMFHGSLQKSSLLDEARHPSPRENECLLWTSQGLRPQQIAHRLGTHPKTVDKQLQNARKKLNAKTNAQAVARAIVLGLIRP